MMKNNILILVALLLSMTARTQSLDQAMCRKMAIENNKKLSIATVEKQLSEFERKAYRSHFFPKVSAMGNYLATNGTTGFTLNGGYLPTFIPSADGSLVPNLYAPNGVPIVGADGMPVFKQYAFMPDTELELDLNNSYTLGVKLEQAIYMGGKVRAINSVAKLANEIAKANIRKATDEVIVASDGAYWQYVRVRELVIVAVKYEEVIEELIRNVKNATELGMKSTSDLLKVQTKLNEAKLMLRKAENGERLAKMNLCYVIGVEMNSNIEVKDVVDHEIVKPSFSGDNIDGRAEVEMLSRQVDIFGEQIRLARSEFMPNVGVVGGYSYVGGMKINDEPLSDDGSFSALVSVSIPIFSWGEGRNKVHSAQEKQKIASLKKEEAQELMRLEANKSFNEFEEAYYRIELTNQSLLAAAENMKNSQDNYEMGMENLVNHLEAQSMWQKAWAEYIDAKAMFQLGKTHYLKSIGGL